MAKTTQFSPDFIPVARKLMMNGATMYELAKYFDVTVLTLRKWIQSNAEFARVIRIGGDFADNRVELAGYELAIGYTQEDIVKEMDENGEEVEKIVERKIPPNVQMVQFWLKNRRGNTWKDKHEITVNHNIQVLTNDQLQLLVGEIIDGSAEEIENPEYLQIPDIKTPGE